MMKYSSESCQSLRTSVTHDAEGYYLEWHIFKDVPINAEILKIIEAP